MADDNIFSNDYDRTAVGTAVLTEAVRHVDIIHTSLAGMTAIILLLAGALSLPMWGIDPVTQILPILVILVTSAVAIAVLYRMNYEVHHHVANQASLTEVLVNSLGQAFLTLDRKGLCGSVYSQACIDLLETIPAGKKISEVLRIEDQKLSDFMDWLDVLFMEDHALSFEDVTNFMPQYFPHTGGRRVRVVYRPIRDKNGHLLQVVLIATDETHEYIAVEKAKQQQAFAEMVMRILKDRNQFRITLNYLREFLIRANSPNIGLEEAISILRHLHTLKAAVRHFSLLDLGDAIQKLESDLKVSGITTDRQFRQQLLAGRQKLSSELDRVTSEFREVIDPENEWGSVVREIDEARLYGFATDLQHLGASAPIIHSYLEKIIAVPLWDCFKVFDRDIHDLTDSMNKRLKPLAFVGDNPRVLTLPWQDFILSLPHIARNIADHGIEAPSTRLARGKDVDGLVTISTRLMAPQGQAAFVEITISDDGNGIDPKLIREKLSVLYPMRNWQNESDADIIQHIFESGFSTRESVSEISGRGIGMDAIEFEIKKLRGRIRVSSTFGKGTSFVITLPYQMDIGFLSLRQGNSYAYGSPVVDR